MCVFVCLSVCLSCSFFLIFLTYFTYQGQFPLPFFLPFPLQTPSYIPSSPTSHPLHRKSKASHGKSTKPGITNWGRAKLLPTASSLSQASHHREWIPKSQLLHQGQMLVPLPGVAKTDLAAQLPSARRGPSSGSCRLPSCLPTVSELPRACLLVY